MNQNVYEQKSANQLVLFFGIPSILALLIEMLTGVTDTAFAGNLPMVGERALSAMAFITPILSIFTALQTLFAMSSGVLVAKYFCKEQMRKHVVMVGLLLSMAVSVTSSLICWIWLTPTLTLIGVPSEILPLAATYMSIQLMSNIISSLGYTMTCIIRALGFPKVEMSIITAAVITNIILNGVFAFGLQMGIAGLAWGTFASELICAVVAFLFLRSQGQIQVHGKLQLKQIALFGGEMLQIGFAQTIIQMLGGCTGFFVNAQLISVGSSLSVAAWSIAQRVYLILLMPIVGLSQGIQTIIAYFNGQGQPEKVKQIAIVTQKYCGGYGVVAVCLVIVFGEKLLLIFGNNPEILVLAKMMMFIIFSCFPLVGIFYTNMTLLQVTGQELASVFLILSRQVFFLLPLLFVLPPVFFAMGFSPMIGLLVATPIADCCTVIISIFLKKKRCY